MAFVRKKLIDIRGGENKDGPTYTLTYYVKTDAACGPFAVRGYVGWSFGDVYSVLGESDVLARVTNMTEEPMGTSRLDWKSTIEFTREQSSSNGGSEPVENPLMEPVGIDWGYEERQIVVERDVSGNWIRNSAKDRYDEVIYADDFRRVLTVTRNEATFPKALADALSNRVNASTWNGYAAKFVKLKPITARRAFHQAIGLYYQVTYEFHFAPIGGDWKRYMLDAGLNEVVSGTKRRMVLDNKPTTVPLALDGSGVKLGLASTPVFTGWELIPTANFALLTLDSIL